MQPERSNRIPHSRFDTAALPARQRLPVWREAASALWHVAPSSDDPFYARVDAFQVDELVVGTVTSSAQRAERTASQVAADGLDGYVLQFYVQGRAAALRRSDEHILANGDLLVVDTIRPVLTEAQAFQTLNLSVPRRLLAPLLTDPDGHAGRRFAAAEPLVALLRSHLRALQYNGPGMSMADAIAVRDPTLALAAAALNGGADERTAGAVRGITWNAVRRFAEAHLDDLTLGSEAVAARFGISRATLYRLSEPAGGFMAFLRERRLWRCRADLGDRAQAHRSIAEIAARWGFGNASAFSVAFARAFGLPPGAYRKMAFNRGAASGTSASGGDWSRWLAALR